MEAWLLSISHASGIYAVMHSPWGWPIIESLHFIGLSLLLATVGMFDLRMLGWFRTLPLAALHRFIPVGVLGFVLNVVTGFMFVSSVPDQYIYNPSFQLKLLCMLGAGLNLVLFYGTTFRSVITATPAPAAMARAQWFATLSLVCWVGVITGGRLITFFRPPFHWCFWCG
jgi:hypothetical protein